MMPNFLCRWPNGDLSIIEADDREQAIIDLDEFGDATEAELFETDQLFINFKLTENGHLEFETFSESFGPEVMEICYPLIVKAQEADQGESEDYPEAAAAERLRVRTTGVEAADELIKNIFLARLVADKFNNDLAGAIEKYKTERPVFNGEWRELAESCVIAIRLGRSTGVMPRGIVDASDLSSYIENDRLPPLLLTAVLAVEMRASVITIWEEVSKHVDEPMGSYWRSLARQVRNLAYPSMAEKLAERK